MLKKYTIIYKKQFKKRKVYKNYNYLNYLKYHSFFYWKPRVLFIRGYSKFFYIVKIPFYVRVFRLIRKLFKNRRILFFSSIFLNKMLTKKYKNSRMGKGVGKRYKWVFSLLPYYPLFIVYNSNIRRLLWISNFLWNHWKIKIFWISTTL